MERVKSSQVLAELYQSAEGPRFRIEFHDLAHYRAFMRAIAGVRRGDRDEVLVEELFPAVYRDVRELRIGLKAGNGRWGKSIYLVRSGADVSVLWCATADQWKENLWLMTGLLKSEGAGHQYFGDNIDDEAVIEIACREPRRAGMMGPCP